MIKELLIQGDIYKFDTDNVITDTRGFKYYESIFNYKKLLIHVNALLFNIGDHVDLNINGMFEESFIITSHTIRYQHELNNISDCYLLLMETTENFLNKEPDAYTFAFIKQSCIRKKIIDSINND